LHNIVIQTTRTIASTFIFVHQQVGCRVASQTWSKRDRCQESKKTKKNSKLADEEQEKRKRSSSFANQSRNIYKGTREAYI
jgi:hypothetical protein